MRHSNTHDRFIVIAKRQIHNHEPSVDGTGHFERTDDGCSLVGV